MIQALYIVFFSSTTLVTLWLLFIADQTFVEKETRDLINPQPISSFLIGTAQIGANLFFFSPVVDILPLVEEHRTSSWWILKSMVFHIDGVIKALFILY